MKQLWTLLFILAIVSSLTRCTTVEQCTPEHYKIEKWVWKPDFY
jgi:hypothetical protein